MWPSVIISQMFCRICCEKSEFLDPELAQGIKGEERSCYVAFAALQCWAWLGALQASHARCSLELPSSRSKLCLAAYGSDNENSWSSQELWCLSFAEAQVLDPNGWTVPCFRNLIPLVLLRIAEVLWNQDSDPRDLHVRSETPGFCLCFSVCWHISLCYTNVLCSQRTHFICLITVNKSKDSLNTPEPGLAPKSEFVYFMLLTRNIFPQVFTLTIFSCTIPELES